MRLLVGGRFLTRDELLERGFSEFAYIAVHDYLPHPKPPYGSDFVHWDGEKFISCMIDSRLKEVSHERE